MTSILGYETQILGALEDSDPMISAQRVKETVVNALRSFDSTARIKTTEYFNHTFAPDLVLDWGNNVPERHVLLRFTDDLWALQDGIESIRASNPLVFGLTTPEPHAEHRSELLNSALEAEILVTTPTAIDALVRKNDATTIRMLRNSLAQGGKGILLDGESAALLVDTVDKGFQGARNHETVSTTDAVDALSANFSSPQASRITEVLRAVWDGSERRAEMFPVATNVSGRLNVEALQYLLEYVDIVDPVFWRRVSTGLTIAELSSVSLSEGNDNYQRLLNACLHSLNAKCCRVEETSLALGFDRDSFLWTPQGKTIHLTAHEFTCTIAQSKDDLPPRVEPRDTLRSRAKIRADKGIDLEMLKKRWDNTEVIEVQLADAIESMDYSSKESTISKDALTAKASTFEFPPLIEKAMVATPSGRILINFEESTATGLTNSRIYLADLVRVAAPLLVSMSEAQANSFQAMFSPSPQDAESLTLDLGSDPTEQT
jgi:hypothetical protein